MYLSSLTGPVSVIDAGRSHLLVPVDSVYCLVLEEVDGGSGRGREEDDGSMNTAAFIFFRSGHEARESSDLIACLLLSFLSFSHLDEYLQSRIIWLTDPFASTIEQLLIETAQYLWLTQPITFVASRSTTSGTWVTDRLTSCTWRWSLYGFVSTSSRSLSPAASHASYSPGVIPSVVPPSISSISSVRSGSSRSVSPFPDRSPVPGTEFQDYLTVPRGGDFLNFPPGAMPRPSGGGSTEFFIPPLAGEAAEPTSSSTIDPIPVVDTSQVQAQAQRATYPQPWAFGAYPPTPYSPYHHPYYPPNPYPSSGGFTPYTPFAPFTPQTPFTSFTPHTPATQPLPPTQPFGPSNAQNTPLPSTPAVLPGVNTGVNTNWNPATPLQPSFPFFPSTPQFNFNLGSATTPYTPNTNLPPLVYGPATPPVLLHPYLTPSILCWDLLHPPSMAKYNSQWGTVKPIGSILNEEAISMLPIPGGGVKVSRLRITSSNSDVLGYWLPIWSPHGIVLNRHRLGDILQAVYEYLRMPLTEEETRLLLGTPGNVHNAREAKRRRARQGFEGVAGAIEGQEGYRRLDCLGVLRAFGGIWVGGVGLLEEEGGLERENMEREIEVELVLGIGQVG
ncbi:hypothetical protein K435DRAFT_798106 [Dendrothele bispora CBS 962.96]|uniref:DUF6699 domain-containing protein n=1 Tax=Dendrothele bispora (strain CBS 962.96) TaxID=1314807 RepID=A0A4S8M0A7_DENBC|nr:hypothetical protein K435DRAFT_798106 [Dendrothele bispora CBS 962.96]